MCIMSDDFNVFKIHVMMTFLNMARKFEVMIEHQDSLCVLGNSRLQWSFRPAKVYQIALTTIDYVHYSRRWIVIFILLFWSWKKDRRWFSVACTRLVNFVALVTTKSFGDAKNVSALSRLWLKQARRVSSRFLFSRGWNVSRTKEHSVHQWSFVRRGLVREKIDVAVFLRHAWQMSTQRNHHLGGWRAAVIAVFSIPSVHGC